MTTTPEEDERRKAMQDMLLHGTGVVREGSDGSVEHIAIRSFYTMTTTLEAIRKLVKRLRRLQLCWDELVDVTNSDSGRVRRGAVAEAQANFNGATEIAASDHILRQAADALEQLREDRHTLQALCNTKSKEMSEQDHLITALRERVTELERERREICNARDEWTRLHASRRQEREAAEADLAEALEVVRLLRRDIPFIYEDDDTHKRVQVALTRSFALLAKHGAQTNDK